MEEFDAARTERAAAVELGPITVAATAGDYYVEIREGTHFTCTCPDAELRLKGRAPCKHCLSLVQQVGERLVKWPAVLESMGGD